MARGRINKVRKVAFIMAALLPDRISVDAANLIANRIEDINNAVVAGIKVRSKGVRLEREHVRGALDEVARSSRQ